MTDEENFQKQLEAMREYEKKCIHSGSFAPVSQQQFFDRAKHAMVLITTIMCIKCGHLFFDTQDTALSTVTEIKHKSN